MDAMENPPALFDIKPHTAYLILILCKSKILDEGRPREAMFHPVFGRSVNSRPTRGKRGGADYAQYITTGPPRFSEGTACLTIGRCSYI